MQGSSWAPFMEPWEVELDFNETLAALLPLLGRR